MSEFNAVVAIEFDDLDTYRHALAIAAHRPDVENEDWDYCVLRERGIEAFLCKRMGFPMVAFDTENTILDATVDVGSLRPESARWVYRKNRREDPQLLGIEPLVSAQGDAVVEYWPRIVEPRFLRRSIEVCSPGEFREALQSGALEARLPLFIKAVQKLTVFGKSLHEVFESPEDLRKFQETSEVGLAYAHRFPDWYSDYLDEVVPGRTVFIPIKGDVILSEVMAIAHDDFPHPRVEYRVFVLDGQPLRPSRYVDYARHDPPADVVAFADDFAKAHAARLPALYVLDIARTVDGRLAVVELNPFANAGRYIENDWREILLGLQLRYNEVIRHRPVASCPIPGPEILAESEGGDLLFEPSLLELADDGDTLVRRPEKTAGEGQALEPSKAKALRPS